jgi:hypothetical protein
MAAGDTRTVVGALSAATGVTGADAALVGESPLLPVPWAMTVKV